MTPGPLITDYEVEITVKRLKHGKADGLFFFFLMFEEEPLETLQPTRK